MRSVFALIITTIAHILLPPSPPSSLRFRRRKSSCLSRLHPPPPSVSPSACMSCPPCPHVPLCCPHGPTGLRLQCFHPDCLAGRVQGYLGLQNPNKQVQMCFQISCIQSPPASPRVLRTWTVPTSPSMDRNPQAASGQGSAPVTPPPHSPPPPFSWAVGCCCVPGQEEQGCRLRDLGPHPSFGVCAQEDVCWSWLPPHRPCPYVQNGEEYYSCHRVIMRFK